MSMRSAASWCQPRHDSVSPRGARMGEDPRTSVVDPYNRCWDVRNVLVTDGACFPSAGCQNPTLTMMAVAIRACRRLATELREG